MRLALWMANMINSSVCVVYAAMLVRSIEEEHVFIF